MLQAASRAHACPSAGEAKPQAPIPTMSCVQCGALRSERVCQPHGPRHRRWSAGGWNDACAIKAECNRRSAREDAGQTNPLLEHPELGPIRVHTSQTPRQLDALSIVRRTSGLPSALGDMASNAFLAPRGRGRRAGRKRRRVAATRSVGNPL